MSTHLTVQPDAWRSKASCRGADLDTFFPSGTGGVAAFQELEAKRICRRCPVAAECLEHAMSARESGVWGGLNDQERKALRKRRQANTWAGLGVAA